MRCRRRRQGDLEQKVLTEPAGVCTTARDSAMASVEVLAGPERRRRWRVEQKQAIVAAAFRSGAVVRGASGRRDAEFGLPLAAGSSRRGEWLRSGAVAPAGDGVAVPPLLAIEIEFAGHARMRIPASVSPALAAAVVEALARR